MAVEVSRASGREDDPAILQGKVRRMVAGDVVRHHRRHRAAIGVSADRVGKERLAFGKSSFRQTRLIDRLHRHHRRGLVRDFHAALGQRGRHRRMTLEAAFACIVGRRHAHRNSSQISGFMAVEVSRASGREDDLAVLQGKVRRMVAGDVVRHHRRHRAAIGVGADRVGKECLAFGKTSFRQTRLVDCMNRNRGRVVDLNYRGRYRVRIGGQCAETAIPRHAGDVNRLENGRTARDIGGCLQPNRCLRRTCWYRDGVTIVQTDDDRTGRSKLANIRRVNDLSALVYRRCRAKLHDSVVGGANYCQGDRMRRRYTVRAIAHRDFVDQRHRLIFGQK